jgi:hypothetical protein
MNYKSKLTDPTYRITFTKKNGQERTIKCKVEPDYHFHSSNYPELVVVQDLEKGGYRTVNTDTISSFELI